MSSSSSVTKLLGLYINNPSVDERALLSEHIFSTFIELLVPEDLALSWLDVSILVQSQSKIKERKGLLCNRIPKDKTKCEATRICRI